MDQTLFLPRFRLDRRLESTQRHHSHRMWVCVLTSSRLLCRTSSSTLTAPLNIVLLASALMLSFEFNQRHLLVTLWYSKASAPSLSIRFVAQFRRYAITSCACTISIAKRLANRILGDERIAPVITSSIRTVDYGADRWAYGKDCTCISRADS